MLILPWVLPILKHVPLPLPRWVVSLHRDNLSPKPIWNDQYKLNHDTIEYKNDCHEKETMWQHSNICPGISIPSLAVYILEPASVNRNNNALLVEMFSYGVQNIKVDKGESENGHNMTGMAYTMDTR